MPRLVNVIIGVVLVLLPAAAIAAETTSYGYDAKGRLVSVNKTGSANNGVAVTYSYDRADNRTNVVVSGAAGSTPPGGTTPGGPRIPPCPTCGPAPQ